MKKNKRIEIKLTSVEYVNLLGMMDVEGDYVLSRFVRKKIFNPEMVLGFSARQLCYELNKIGVNINQIARVLNYGSGCPELYKELVEIKVSINDALRFVQK